jgi:hypothetical protein
MSDVFYECILVGPALQIIVDFFSYRQPELVICGRLTDQGVGGVLGQIVLSTLVVPQDSSG